jgi:hypothetical protein
MAIWAPPQQVSCPTRARSERHVTKRALVEFCLVALVVVSGTALRLADLDANPFWVDEAESSINALTILTNGYPTDRYLGLPIYENTLLKPWPESSEYQFRDLSYSEKHFAIYHGWLPLYAIAGSFALHHIQPDKADGKLSVKHGVSEWRRRTRAGRLPGVLFGAAFFLIVFYGASVMYGRDAGWAALIIGAIHPWHFILSREARYYSAQITLTTACCVLLWVVLKRCTWKATCTTALAFILLFHTHLLSFCTAVAVFLLVLPLILRRHNGAVRKMAVFTAIVAAGTLPWVIVTGFYADQGGIPRAWPILQLPADIFRYPPVTLSNALVGAVVVIVMGWLLLAKSRVSTRLRGPARRLAPLLLFLGAWALCGYAAFFLCIPAMSFAPNRMNLSYWGPLFLLESAICASIARSLAPRFAAFLAPLIMLLLFFGGGGRLRFPGPTTNLWKPLETVFNHLDALHLKSNARIYAAPNEHLILTFYSGLPVRDMTAIRKSYLDNYKGDVVYVDSNIVVKTGVLTPQRVRQTALRYGLALSPDVAGRWAAVLRTRDYREAMLKIVSPGAGKQLEPLPLFALELLRVHNQRASLLLSENNLDIVTRGFDLHNWADWRAILKYRFVDPAAHSGLRANYAERLRGADVTILPEADTAIYYSRWHPSAQRNETHR